jgi:hypothetical protein
MKKLLSPLSYSFILLGLLVLAGPRTVSAAPPEEVRPYPDFHDSLGWFGADDAYSIPLDAERSLWLFGDTFVGDRDMQARHQYKFMVRNSVGISTCKAGSACAMEYFWKNPYTPASRSFFDTGDDKVWYWPLDAWRDGKKLYVSLLVVRDNPKASSEALGFEITGTRMAIVKDVYASPDKWKVTIQELTNARFWVGATVVEDGNFVLWYTQVSQGEAKGFMTVLRVPKNKMKNPAKSFEYLKKDGTWAKGLPGTDAMHVIDQAISEMSVRYHPSIRKWVAVVPGPGFPTPQVDARTADSPIGPWSAPQKIFEFPEMKSDWHAYDKDTFCYATKEHPEFSDSKLVLSYTCNSMVVAKAVANGDIYRPRIVVLDLPH